MVTNLRNLYKKMQRLEARVAELEKALAKPAAASKAKAKKEVSK